MFGNVFILVKSGSPCVRVNKKVLTMDTLGFCGDSYVVAEPLDNPEVAEYMGDGDVLVYYRGDVVIVQSRYGYVLPVFRNYYDIVKEDGKYFVFIHGYGKLLISNCVAVGLRYFSKYRENRYVDVFVGNGSPFIVGYGILGN